MWIFCHILRQYIRNKYNNKKSYVINTNILWFWHMMFQM